MERTRRRGSLIANVQQELTALVEDVHLGDTGFHQRLHLAVEHIGIQSEYHCMINCAATSRTVDIESSEPEPHMELLNVPDALVFKCTYHKE